MASVGHAMVGMAAGRWYAGNGPARPWLAMAILAALALLPDADVVAFALGIPYADAFGHRGASHSICVALLLGGCAALLAPRLQQPRWRCALCVGLTVLSHGLLDTLTDGGLGVALLWPLSAQRFFAPWRPLPVAPIGAHFLSARGLQVALIECLWFFPALLYALWPRRKRLLTSTDEAM